MSHGSASSGVLARPLQVENTSGFRWLRTLVLKPVELLFNDTVD